jgi:hypothetical protein
MFGFTGCRLCAMGENQEVSRAQKPWSEKRKPKARQLKAHYGRLEK